MTLKRRILFYSFTLLFFIAGGYLLFIAQGYRYSPEKGSVELTGEISVDSRPRGARIELNGEAPLALFDRLKGKEDVSTPTRIRSLLSGVYRLALKKDGYYPWTRIVTVFAGKAVVLGDVQLLPVVKEIPAVSTPQIAELLPLPDSQLLYRTSDHVIGLLDVHGKRVKEIFRASEDIRSIALSPSGKKVFVHGISRGWLVSIDDVRIPVVTLSSEAIQKFIWSPRDELYALTNKGISLFIPRSGKLKEVIRGSFVDLSVHDQLVGLDSQHMVRMYDARTYARIAQRNMNADRIIIFSDELLVLADSLRGELILFPESSLASTPTRIPHAHSFLRIDHERYVVWDDFEVTLLTQGDSGTLQRLITRQSTPIRQVTVSKVAPYVFILNQNGSVSAQELSGESQNYYQLFNAESVTSMSEKKNTLYLVGTFKESSGLIVAPLLP